MLSKINEIVLTSLKNYNPNFKDLTINNNVLSLNKDYLVLENFNLETLFESYQLKLDLLNMNSNDLFKIIKLNVNLFNSNKGGI